MKKSKISKYGFPSTVEEIEHEDDECAACVKAGPLSKGDVVFIVIHDDDGDRIRRCEGDVVKGFFVRPGAFGYTRDEQPALLCAEVSSEAADVEIEDSKTGGYYVKDPSEKVDDKEGISVSIVEDLIDMLVSPERFVYRYGLALGEKLNAENPCKCGHGKRQHSDLATLACKRCLCVTYEKA